MEQEIWKDIPGYEGKYQASTLGRIKSLNYLNTKEEKIIGINNISKGYRNVQLSKNGINKTYFHHVLIAMTFLDHTICGHDVVVDHINGDKLNNKLENLRLVSNRFNINRARIKKSNLPLGVRFNDKSNKKYQARIYIDKKIKSLGYYYTPEEASAAYQTALNNLN